MRFAKTILCVLLAFAWAPLTAHCQLEIIADFDFLACASECGPHSAPTPPDDEACCAVESSQYKPEEEQPIVSPAHFVLLFVPAALELQAAGPVDVPREALASGPPALASSWQFLLRTALPVRAPSPAS